MSLFRVSKRLFSRASTHPFNTNGFSFKPARFNDLQAYIPPISEIMSHEESLKNILPFNSGSLMHLSCGSYRNFAAYSTALEDFTRFYYSTCPIHSKYQQKGDSRNWMYGASGNIVALSTHGGPSNIYGTAAHVLAPKLIREKHNASYEFELNNNYELYGVDFDDSERVHSMDISEETEWNLQSISLFIPGPGIVEIMPWDLDILYVDNIADIAIFQISAKAQCSMIISSDMDELNDPNNAVIYMYSFYDGLDDSDPKHSVCDMFSNPIPKQELINLFGDSSFVGWDKSAFRTVLVDYLKNNNIPELEIPKSLINVVTNNNGIKYVKHYLYSLVGSSGSGISVQGGIINAIHNSTKRHITSKGQEIYLNNKAALFTEEMVELIKNK